MRAETMTQTGTPGLNRHGLALVTLIVSVTISVVHIWMNSFGSVAVLTQNGFHFAGFVLLCVLVSPIAGVSWQKHPAIRTLDIAFGVAVAAAAIYVINAETAIYERGVRLIWSDWLAGILCILGVLEFTRRTTGCR